MQREREKNWSLYCCSPGWTWSWLPNTQTQVNIITHKEKDIYRKKKITSGSLSNGIPFWQFKSVCLLKPTMSFSLTNLIPLHTSLTTTTCCLVAFGHVTPRQRLNTNKLQLKITYSYSWLSRLITFFVFLKADADTCCGATQHFRISNKGYLWYVKLSKLLQVFKGHVDLLMCIFCTFIIIIIIIVIIFSGSSSSSLLLKC